MRGFCWASICSAVLAAAAGAGCTSAIPRPTAADAAWAGSRWPETDARSLAQGRDLYVAKCSGCHHLYPPERVVTHDWPDHFDEMADMAEVEEGRRQSIFRYLVTVTRSDRAPAGVATSGDAQEKRARRD